MAALEKPGPADRDLYEDVSREDIVAAFRVAMIGHFRSHIPGTNINESTLLASDYLNHFHELVMLFEAIASEPQDFTRDLLSWRPLTYEEHFAESGFRDKNLAIAAYRRAIELAPHLGEVWWSLANLKTVRFDDADVAAMEAALDDAAHANHELGPKALRLAQEGVVVANDDLRDSRAVADIDEQDAAQIADSVHPAEQEHLLIEVIGAKRAARVRSLPVSERFCHQ